jgi:drug/metabolite transporter (DMT)-like permease
MNIRIAAAYLGVVLIWSTTPLSIRWSSEGIGFDVALTLRMAISLLLSYGWMRLQGYRMPFDRGALYIYAYSSLGTFAAMLFVYWASQYISSGLVSVLFGLSPIVVGIFASLWLREDFFRLNKVAGAIAGLLGLIVIFRHQLQLGADGWKGVLGMLVSVTFYSISLVLVKRSAATYLPSVINTGSLLMSVPVLVLISYAGGHPADVGEMPARAVAALWYLGIFGSFIGFILYYELLKNLSAGSVTLIPLITPVLAMLLGNALNGEPLSASIWWGAGLILSGLLLYQWPALYALFRKSESPSANKGD